MVGRMLVQPRKLKRKPMPITRGMQAHDLSHHHYEGGGQTAQALAQICGQGIAGGSCRSLGWHVASMPSSRPR
jgi:hypothetical protein